MPLRLFAAFALTVLTLGLLTSVAPASAQPAPVKPLGALVANFGPPSTTLYDLDDLATFSWTLHRELTGPAGQRVYGVYKDTFKTEAGLVPATPSANGRFVIDW